MNQNDNLPNETVARLRQTIKDGKLSVEEIEGALKKRIEEELEKPYDQIDGELVDTMLGMLDDTAKVLRPNEEKIRRQSYSELMAAVDQVDAKPDRKEKPKNFHLFIRVAAVIAILWTGMMVYDVFLGPKGFDISHTGDGQQRIVANVTHAPAMLQEGIAGVESGSLTTKDIKEVSAFLGYHPPIPNALVGGWTMYDVSASRNDFRDVLIVSYEKEGAPELLVFNYVHYGSSEARIQAVEQDGEGRDVITPNGLKVYVTQNVDSTIGSWEAKNETFYVNGPISLETLLSVIDEITKAGG